MREREEYIKDIWTEIILRSAKMLDADFTMPHDIARERAFTEVIGRVLDKREALAAATRATALVDENHPETPERSTRVTDEMVERAAKAMCDDAARFGGSVAPWHMSRENERNSWRESALTVLTAALEGPRDQ